MSGQGAGVPAGGTTAILILQAHLPLLLFVIFYKLKVVGNPASSKSAGTIFPAASAQCVCRVLVILTSLPCFGHSHSISNFFIIFIMVNYDQ